MSKNPADAPDRISKKFQNRILEIIDDEDCDKFELGRRAGISKPVMTRATLYGIIPTVPILIRLANHLNIPIAYLLGESDDKAFFKSDSPTTFHIRLEELKTERRTTYSKMASIMSFPCNYFYDWIRTKSLPSLEFLKPIAQYFKVSLDYLLGRTDYKK